MKKRLREGVEELIQDAADHLDSSRNSSSEEVAEVLAVMSIASSLLAIAVKLNERHI